MGLNDFGFDFEMGLYDFGFDIYVFWNKFEGLVK